jgi:hypothetical protein
VHCKKFQRSSFLAVQRDQRQSHFRAWARCAGVIHLGALDSSVALGP